MSGTGEPDGGDLREQLETLLQGNKERKATIQAKTFEYALGDAGFEPDSAEAKAIQRTYHPDAEVTPDAIARFAKEELGFTPTPALSDEEVKAHMRAEGEARLAMVNAGTIPLGSGDYGMSLKDQARRAEAEGDWDEVGRINAQMLQRMRDGGSY